MMNNKLPPSYGALYGNRVPLPKNQGYLLPKNEEISKEEGPSNEKIIEMPPPPSQNENQQTQDEIQEEILLKIIAAINFLCFFWWLFTLLVLLQKELS